MKLNKRAQKRRGHGLPRVVRDLGVEPVSRLSYFTLYNYVVDLLMSDIDEARTDIGHRATRERLRKDCVHGTFGDFRRWPIAAFLCNGGTYLGFLRYGDRSGITIKIKRRRNECWETLGVFPIGTLALKNRLPPSVYNYISKDVK